MDAAESVLRDAVDGIPPAHLFACAEAYHVETLRLCLQRTQHQHLSLITLRLCLQCTLHLSFSSSRFQVVLV